MLNTAVQGGAIALVAFVFFLWCVIQAVAKLRSLMMEDARTASAVSATYASLIAGIVALFLYPFSLTLFFVLFTLLACAALAQVGARAFRLNIEEKPSYSLAASLGFIIGLIAVLTGSYFSATRYAADVAYAKVGEQKDSTAALAKLQTAINWDGKVLACCSVYSEKHHYGSIHEQDFGAIWNGEMYTEARREIVGQSPTKETICKTCKQNGYLFL